MTDRESKFNVSSDKDKRTWDGIVFDSVMEMLFYRDVILPLYGDDKIKSFEIQKRYELQPAFEHDGMKERPIVYVADFVVENSDGETVVIDIKGYADPVAKMKRKMFLYKYRDLDYRWLTFSKIDGGWVKYETVAKNRKTRKKLKLAAKELLKGEDTNGEERE